MTDATRNRRRTSEVVDAAAKLFHENGYDATTVQDVADALGILKGSVYHYIKTKEDLLFAVVEQAHEATIANLQQVHDLDGDVPAKLRAFVRAHMELLFRERIKIGVYLHDFRSLNDDHRRVVAERRREYADHLTALIEQGQREGTISADRDPHLSTLALLGMLNWAYEWYREDGREDPHRIMDEFAEIALRGLTGP
jgi:AcrR family transcriptional regulator